MAVPTKRYFSDRIIAGLQAQYPNIDFRSIQEREVFLVVDDIINAMAKDNYLSNWKLYGATVEEGFITTWTGLQVVDPDEAPSYITFPAVYAALPMNGGIVEVWPENYEYGAVKLRRHEDVRRTRNLMSGNMQGELGGYPKGNVFEFDQVDVGKNFSETFGMRLVVRDSSAIAVTAPFPIHSDLVEEVIRRGILFFSTKRMQPTDTIRDKNDSINRN